jgi:signal transduction histidine kinase
LRNSSESGAAGCGEVPLLLECDGSGTVLWMSDRARSVLGGIERLSTTVVTEESALFHRVMSTGNQVLLAALPNDVQPVRCPEVALLGRLQSALMRQFFRLLLVERRLSLRVRQHQQGGGRQAIRQVERERQRLGRELHTGIGQTLAAIRLQLEVIGVQLPEAPEGVTQALARISSLAADALDEVRSVSRRVHPPEWQRLSLPAALDQLWQMSGIPQRFEASLRLEELAREPEQEIKVLFYRAAQEALSNLVRHARATRIEMVLARRGSGLSLRISDNGVGFDPARMFSAPANVDSGIGLRSIREQASAVGGRLDIESGPMGTTLLISAAYTPLET